jgi:hypothetical protein
MPIPVGSCEVWFGYRTTGDPDLMYTHLAYDLTDAPDQTSVDAGFAQFNTLFRVQVNSDWTLEGHFILVGSDPGTVRWDYGGAAVAGNSGLATVPQNTAWLVKKISGLGGRRNRGRMYFPGVSESVVDNKGELTSGQITALNTLVGSLKVGGSVHTAFGFLGQMQILHETGSQTPTEVTDLVVQKVVATQRRRLRR